MLEVILKGHDKFYLVSDVVRMFCGVPEELKDESKVIAPEGPDITLVNELFPDGRSVTPFNGEKHAVGLSYRNKTYACCLGRRKCRRSHDKVFCKSR